VIHYPLARARLLRWLPPRCSCGVARYDRCPDRPGATDPPPAAPMLGILLAIAVLTVGAAVGLWEVVS
jgi:hypothetical protein